MNKASNVAVEILLIILNSSAISCLVLSCLFGN